MSGERKLVKEQEEKDLEVKTNDEQEDENNKERTFTIGDVVPVVQDHENRLTNIESALNRMRGAL